MPRLMVTGANGQVGFELARALAPLGDVVSLTRRDCELTDEVALRRCLDEVRPDVIVNPAAWTAVDRAESDPATTFMVNAELPARLAEEASRRGVLLVHYSTDYVFDGSLDRPYREDDPTHPLSVYGLSKCKGEEAVRASEARHLILRTSWVYGTHGANFVKTVLRLAAERESLSMVADQIGAPTSSALIADATAHMVAHYLREPGRFAGGTYHLTAAGETSWHGLARFVVQTALELGWPLSLSPDAILPIPASGYPLPAARPANSRLDTSRVRYDFGLTLPPWQDGVRQMLISMDALRRTV
ncbi:dTDP-4-dehydrorhamnose reductase [Paludibacterium yongneupense]|uniref:dTDP-4-dehydrorhamnose reductase n=1 Tax=Paludibacterium yongneupense TaxID=400061 RepID=UPI0004098A52|nr:dTDP-4-dehydrorhamnose reductase [Paludibacterium yongneupense]